jgi:cell division protein FtsN
VPDERQDSIRKGIHAPEESPSGSAAERERQKRVAQDPPIDSAMGGTSDASRPADEAQLNAARAQSEARAAQPRQDQAQEAPRDRDRTIEETREAGLRSQGGGSSDEQEIERSAGDGSPGR